jgi:hypothetical protein
MNDEEVATVRKQCHVIVHGVNNIFKEQISYKDDSLVESFWGESICDMENMGNRVEE